MIEIDPTVSIENIDSLSKEKYERERITHWNNVADRSKRGLFSSYYHKRLKDIYSFLIPQGSRVLEIGCGSGDLLSSLHPIHGVGIDFSENMINKARMNHPELILYCVSTYDIESVFPREEFDYIILSDLLNDLWDVQTALQIISRYCNKRTRVIVNFYSRLWQPVLSLAQKIGLAQPVLMQNWLIKEDVENLLHLANFEAIKNWQEILLPLSIPLFGNFANKFLAKIWPIQSLNLSNFIVARPEPLETEQEYVVSVIVPARNEAGNIENIFKRTPEMGLGTEIIFVEGNSSDNTYQTIEGAIKKFPNRNASLLRQDGIGKGDAVRKGFAAAKGDILMILDADLTVPPEDLPRFYKAIVSNKGEFINGVRLVYPMEKDAMRFFNFLGNKFFSLAFSWLLGQPVKDSLCGTKVVWKDEYNHIVENRAYFGDFDPFGDFDLLFGAAKLGLRIIDIPIRYRERVYGTTNIQRWKHGLLLLRMVLFAAGRLKFV
jgi:ubiquinone/menaquinone biosynthesis C-methylase UbiE